MMDSFLLSKRQKEIIVNSNNKKIFLSGPVGSGKTTVGLSWIKHLIDSGANADSILVMVPQRSLATKYYDLVSDPQFPKGSTPTIVTFGGLAQRIIDLFWPEVSRASGFSHPNLPPTFLTLETAQYLLAKITKPFLDKGYFENLTIDRNRLYSQILDNLNKSALIGYPFDTFSERLKSAWIGDESRLITYDQAQEVAIQFRQYCLEHNLLDYSLQIEVFIKFLWPSFLVNNYLRSKYQHLVFDNIEEDSPVCHDLLREWLPTFQSALLIFDTNAGHRTFLGADPESAFSLSQGLVLYNLNDSLTAPSTILGFHDSLTNILQKKTAVIPESMNSVFSIIPQHYVPEMTAWVADQVKELISQKSIPPHEIVILAPYMSDSLRYSLVQSLESREIPVRSNRPSRSLRDEPASQALITLARIAHPAWEIKPPKVEVRQTFMQILTNGDLIRADLLAQILYSPARSDQIFGTFDTINPEMQERITYTIGNKFENLKTWLVEYQEHPLADLDVFWSRLFGEVLSQPGFGFHQSFDSAAVVSHLIESFQKFRRVIESSAFDRSTPIGKEYIQMVKEGVIAAQYLPSPENDPQDAVLIAPAYSFLLTNQAVKVQFWLDIGSQGWWQRPDQPLTHPYVLSRHWHKDGKWTDVNEFETNQKMLARLVGGLILRCTEHIFLCPLALNERGMEESGPLLMAINKIRKQMAANKANDV
jgi:hypothetical protein